VIAWPLLPAGALAVSAAVAWRVHRFGQQPPRLPPAPRVAVVLGARVFEDGTPSDALRGRVEVGVRLLASGHASALLFSGGSTDARPAEAEVARCLALAAGAPASSLLLEAASRSTFENARETAAVLEARGDREVILITCDFHLLRATAHFVAHGLQVFPVASPRPLRAPERVAATAREAAALLRRPWLLASVRWTR
jgi:uncharacterized SAM-binding protein YcdF (DUF218 family)